MYSGLVGRRLEDARAILAVRSPVEAPTITVVETAPPFQPKFRRPLWGDLRVLRVRPREDGVEFLVARELLGEEILPKGTAAAQAEPA